MALPVALGDVCLITSQGTASRGAVVQALNMADGQLRWERPFDGAIVGSLTASSYNEALITLIGTESHSDKELLKMTAGGGVVWRHALPARIASAPAAGTAYVAITVGGDTLRFLSVETGREALDVELPVEASVWAPALDDAGTIYVPCQAPSLLAVSDDGDLRWRFDLDGMLSSVWLDQTPLVVGSVLVAVLSSGTVLALDRAGGQLVWETRVGPRGKRLTCPVTDGKRVFVGARDGVYALDLDTGAPAWVFRTGVYVAAAPVVQDEILFVAGRDRRFTALDRRTGHVHWQYTMDREIKMPPVVTHGGDDGPFAVVVDCAGEVTGLTYPLSALEHERAERWRKAALAWEQTGNAWKAAEAWSNHAASLADQHQAVDDQAHAWSAAARLYASVGAEEKAAACRRQYARCLGLPLITLEVHHPGLVRASWSRLRFIIRNQGYGLAKEVTIGVKGEAFAGQIAETRKVAALPAGQRLEQELDVKPLEHGESVPLRVLMSYQDGGDARHEREETLYLPVADAASERAPGILRLGEDISLLAGLVGRRITPSAVDLELRIGRGGNSYYTLELTLDGERVFSGGRLPRTALNLQTSGDLVRDGRRLFDLLFGDPHIWEGWLIARGQAESQKLKRRLRLRIDEAVAELHHVPWELMTEQDTMLAANEMTPFSRYLPVSQPWGVQIAERPIRVLAVLSNPRDLASRYALPSLNMKMEKYLIARAFAQIDPGQVKLKFLKPPVTLDRLARALLEGYHWLHFVGHGHYNAHQQRFNLLMEDNHGGTRAIGENLLCRMLAHRGAQPQLVFLSVCQSALDANNDDMLTGLAPALVRIGVPAVVAMRDRVHMRTAQKVTEIFYSRLVDHGIVDLAMNQARDAVLSAQLPDIASPVLFMRQPSGRLWEVVS